MSKLNITKMRKRLFHIAHSIKAFFSTWSEALVHAWKVIRLQYNLCTEAIVHFTYKKVDGTIREAVGTNETVPAPKGERRSPRFDLLTYFDLQQREFRSCRIELIIF